MLDQQRTTFVEVWLAIFRLLLLCSGWNDSNVSIIQMIISFANIVSIPLNLKLTLKTGQNFNLILFFFLIKFK